MLAHFGGRKSDFYACDSSSDRIFAAITARAFFLHNTEIKKHTST